MYDHKSAKKLVPIGDSAELDPVPGVIHIPVAAVVDRWSPRVTESSSWHSRIFSGP